MRIAVLGTGLMGSALAETLLGAGHEVFVYNRTIIKTEPLVALGAKAVATPAEAIDAADATLLVLADGSAVRATLLDEATRSSLAGRRLLNVTTTTPDEIIAISREVAEHGGDLAEVSVTVYPHHVRAMRGQYLLGCGVVDESFWTGILRSVGESVYRAGDVGDASRAETPFVSVFLFNTMAIAFAAAVGRKLDVSPAILEHVLTSNPTLAVTGAAELLPQMFERKYTESLASIDNLLFAADMTFEMAKSLGLPTRVVEGMLDLCRSAAARGLGGKDVAGVFEALFEPDAAGS